MRALPLSDAAAVCAPLVRRYVQSRDARVRVCEEQKLLVVEHAAHEVSDPQPNRQPRPAVRVQLLRQDLKERYFAITFSAHAQTASRTRFTTPERKTLHHHSPLMGGEALRA